MKRADIFIAICLAGGFLFTGLFFWSEESGGGENVSTLRCWSCQKSFDVSASRTQGKCPHCGARYVLSSPSSKPPWVSRGKRLDPYKRIVKTFRIVKTVPSPEQEDVRSPFRGLWYSAGEETGVEGIDSVYFCVFWMGPETEDNIFRLSLKKEGETVVKRGNFAVRESVLYLYDRPGQMLGEGKLAEKHLTLKMAESFEGIAELEMHKEEPCRKYLRNGFTEFPGQPVNVQLEFTGLDESEVKRIGAAMKSALADGKLAREELETFFGPSSRIDEEAISGEFLGEVEAEIKSAVQDSVVTKEEIRGIRGKIERELTDIGQLIDLSGRIDRRGDF